MAIKDKPGAVIAANQWFPFPTRLVRNPITTQVGVAPTQLLLNNPDRIAWIIHNRSPNAMDIDFIPTLVLGQAIPLTPNGGFFGLKVQEDGEAVINDVWAISGVAASAVFVLEIERV